MQWNGGEGDYKAQRQRDDVIVFQPAVPSCCAVAEHQSANCENEH